MLGGLYGDLPPPSSTDEDRPVNPSTNVWSSSVKMAPPTLRNKPSFPPPQTILKSHPKPKNPTPTPTKTTTVTLSTATTATTTTTTTEGFKSPSPTPSFQLVGLAVVEEYDPSRPNDYEEYKRERKRKAAEAELSRELERRRLEEEERERREKEERERERERERELNVSGEEAWKRRAAMGGGGGVAAASVEEVVGGGFSIGRSETAGLGLGVGGNMTMAQRMMAKMGWKEGQGLGRQEQGITTPLMAKKTDRRAGIIVNASAITSESKEKQQPAEKKQKGANINGPPTRVTQTGELHQNFGDDVLLEYIDMLLFLVPNPNLSIEAKRSIDSGSFSEIKMSFKTVIDRLLAVAGKPGERWRFALVGPGEVDDDLENEVAMECAKYGTVTRVLIFEITEPDFPADEAVRIFVQFERGAEATKALVDLEGRFFGGRVVRATFYEEERFNKNELAPMPGEIPGFS
ncbi:hypothetical protein RJ639_021740 [Escallonia herrerae]|uniref:Uncharacterized protein n=1 Tax=Escallonia herrerae TaxID=1293975 RepID=A0AA88V336_9ASTE|nr:hypothetical protein RJ639_021740 [Escallonia herrerae]